MAICGVDLGNLSMLIAQTSKGGVDVILNDASNRQTASYISVQGKQRFIGDAGAAMARSNVTNTISNMKLLVGRFYDEPEVQKEIARCPFKCSKLPNGGVGIDIMYNDEMITVASEHMLAVLLKQANEVVKMNNAGVAMADGVVAVPYWFTELQRRAIMVACEIAQIHCLKVVNEPTAIALGYGIYKSAKGLFHATEPTNVMFIDMGYTGYTVSVFSYTADGMKMLACQGNAHLGGRDIDALIVDMLVQKFQAATKIDVRGNKKALLKLQAAAEKAKKTLSPHGVTEASCSVECLAEERDLATILKRDDFEAALGPLVAQLEKPIEDALAECGLTRSQLAEVEIVGGSTRVNLIKKRLSEILQLDAAAMNYGLKTTMNADEAVVRGCALQCAIESSRVKVKPFNIVDRVGYAINASFDNAAAAAGESGDSDVVEIYSRGDEVPRKPKRLTFRRHDKADFTIHMTYAASAQQYLPPGTDMRVADFTVKMPQPYPVEPGMNSDEPHDVRVTFNLDKNGCVYISKAELMVEIPSAPAAPAAEEGKTAEPAAEGETAPAAAASTEESKGGDAEPMEGVAAAAAKRKYKKVDLAVDTVIPGLISRQQVKDCSELEASMAFEDQMIKETADKRNELESYIYSMRTKLDGKLKHYGATAEVADLKKNIDAAEDWLYGDGYDATKSQYAKRLEELSTVGKAMESRMWEEANRPASIDQLKVQLERCRSFCGIRDEAHEHITDEDRASIRKECDEAEGWMFDMMGKQGDCKAYENPALTVGMINGRRQGLFNKTNPIMTKPKPKPAPAPAPAPAAATPPPTSGNNTPPPPADGENTKTADAEPMEASEGKDGESSPAACSEGDAKGEDAKGEATAMEQ